MGKGEKHRAIRNISVIPYIWEYCFSQTIFIDKEKYFGWGEKDSPTAQVVKIRFQVQQRWCCREGECINERAPTQLVVNANGFFPMITFAGSGGYLGDRFLAGGSRSPSVCPRSLCVVPDSLVLLSLLAGCCEGRLLPMVLPQCVPMNHVDKCLMTETLKLGGKRQAKSFCL